jgi:hypothetical protein
MTPQDIKAFVEQTEAVCSRATKGKWYWDEGYPDENLLLTTDESCVVMKPYYDDDAGEVTINIFDNDKDFIAASRTALPRACEIIKELMAELADANERFDIINGAFEEAKGE